MCMLHTIIRMNIIQKRDILIQIAQLASEVILHEKHTHLRVWSKPDHSTVTSADLASEQVILRELRNHFPQTPVVSEEEHASGKRVTWTHNAWLVDPLDSTSGFARGSSDYAICIAEIVNNQPEWGVIAIPEPGITYVGHVSSQQCWKVQGGNLTQLLPPQQHETPYSCVLSPTDALVRKLVSDWQIQFRGSALKFGLVAEGASDIYVRSGHLMSWDIAAGDAIVRSLGGSCTTHTGAPFVYACNQSYMMPFVARSSAVRSHPL